MPSSHQKLGSTTLAAGPDLDETLEQQVGPAAEIALHGARGNTDDRAEEGEHEPEEDRDAEAVDEPGHHIACLVVGPQPVLRAGRRGGGDRQVPGNRAVVVAHRRPEHPALGVDEVPDEGIAVIGLGLELAAELGLGIGPESRRIDLAVEVDQHRRVVGDDLGDQTEPEQRQEDPERPEAPPVGAEIVQPPPIERRDLEAEDAFLAGQCGAHLRPPGARSRYADRPRCT
jgi:hypothetical protein